MDKPNVKNTEAIQKALADIAEKYGFKKIIFLGQEEEEGTGKLICRCCIMDTKADLSKPELDVHGFAEFFEGCLMNSKAFRDISNHTATHLMGKAVHDMSFHDKVKEGGKRAD